MYVGRSIENGLLHGWYRSGSLDLFLWFDGPTLVHAQLACAGSLAEWRAPNMLSTGGVSESGFSQISSNSGLIRFDHAAQEKRVEAIVQGVQTSELPPEVKSFALSILERRVSADEMLLIERVIQAAPAIGQKR